MTDPLLTFIVVAFALVVIVYLVTMFVYAAVALVEILVEWWHHK